MLVFPIYLSINIFICLYVYNIFILFTEINPIMFHLYKKKTLLPQNINIHFFHYFDLLYTQNSFRIISPIPAVRTKLLENIGFFVFSFYFIFSLDCRSRPFIQKLLENSFFCDYYQFDMKFD